MSVHIIIDGYNFIRQSEELSLLDARDLQQGREALLDLLVRYRRVKPHPITIVFDGTGAPGYYQRHDRIRGIQVVFSPPGRTADSVIKKTAAEKREKAIVVSSDRELAGFAESVGAAVIPSPEFDRKVTRALLADGDAAETEEAETAGWHPGAKKRGPRRRPSKKDRQHRRKTRKL